MPANAGMTYIAHSHMTLLNTMCETSGDCSPYVQGGSLLLNAEDGGFGMDVLRVEKPFDISGGREGRIHYRSDMKGHPRQFQVIHITPTISNSIADLRIREHGLNAGRAVDILFAGDGGAPFAVLNWNGDTLVEQYFSQGALGITPGAFRDVDVYVSRTRVRLLLDGTVILDTRLQDIGFDRGYVHFAQLAYNPVKDGYSADAGNRFVWDNLAFDGPSLARNSLTPADKKEVLFRAWGKSSCTVRGIQANGPVTPRGIFDTWQIQLGVNDAPISTSEISCTKFIDYGTPNNQPELGGIEYVKQ